MPPPRTDAPMNPVELQKATEDLITERDRLNAEAPPNSQGQVAASGTTGKAVRSTAKARSKVSKAAPQQTAAVPPATTASAQGAGMQGAGSDLKP